MFAFAPFIGAALAVALGDRSATSTGTKRWSMKTRTAKTTGIKTMSTTPCRRGNIAIVTNMNHGDTRTITCPMLTTGTVIERRPLRANAPTAGPRKLR